MQKNPKDTVVEVLAIIGYEDDTNAFADEFIANCEKQAFLDLIKTLPPERQESIKQKMKVATDAEELKTMFTEYVSSQTYNQALKLAAQNAFSEFVRAIIPTLTADQSTNLQTYLRQIAV